MSEQIEIPEDFDYKSLKINIFGKDLTLKVSEVTKDTYIEPLYFGGMVVGNIGRSNTLKISAYAEDTKAKEIREAREKVNATKEEYKEAKRKLSKLLEK